MITPTSGSITTQPETFDGIWLQSIQINAPKPTGKIWATIRAIPFNSSTGVVAPSSYSKTLNVSDIMSQSLETPSVGIAMNAMVTAVQELILSRSLF